LTTPIIMLALLIAPYLGMRLLGRSGRNDQRASAAAGLGAVFVFTGIGHFARTQAMVEMLPPWVPVRTYLVYLSGVLELLLALGFFIRETRRITGWVTILVLLLFFPLNIYSALNYVPMGGHAWGPIYLWVRGPLQGLLLLWIYRFTISNET